MKKLLFPAGLLLITAVLAACSEVGYYLQCASGQLQVMRASRPIDRVLEDPQTSPEVRRKLRKVQSLRAFSVTELGLPDNSSYREYADIGRPYVIWNVVAAGEFSLQPHRWCFPVAGCVSYKGFFNQEDAAAQARRLRAENLDVDLYGVEAYSTLKWFADPVLNTFIDSSEARLAGLLFHELAHQLLYVPDDSAFNEGFAMTVQSAGVRRWFTRTAAPEAWQRYLEQRAQVRVFQGFLTETRDSLADLYRRDLPAASMRNEKRKLIDRALDRYATLQETGQLDQRFDRWMERGLNNARLAGIATYRELMPGFERLLRACNDDLPCFYQRVRELSTLPPAERLAHLQVPPEQPEPRRRTPSRTAALNPSPVPVSRE